MQWFPPVNVCVAVRRMYSACMGVLCVPIVYGDPVVCSMGVLRCMNMNPVSCVCMVCIMLL